MRGSRAARQLRERGYAMRSIHVRLVCPCLFWLSLSASSGGCASTHGRLEKVAKDWCETIRASQVMCTYPVSEDLVPGDVFLVQEPLSTEQKLYARKGFLPLSDHRMRLPDLNYASMYFDGYWKWADAFGNTPHDRPSRSGAGQVPQDGAPPVLTEVPAPRVAFPAYAFEVSNQHGLGLAIPVKGVPVGLNFLHADRATGSVLIADARTYGARSDQLYDALLRWLEDDPAARATLEALAKPAQGPLYLRVVSRVYLAGGMMVHLNRTATSGGGATAGAGPSVSLIESTGKIADDVKAAMAELEKRGNPSSVEPGGTFKFVSSSNSSVTLSESFDRLLVVGYLGFDVPVFPDGCLGVPIPTFERIERSAEALPAVKAGAWAPAQQRFKLEEEALERMVEKEPRRAIAAMRYVVGRLRAPEFRDVPAALASAEAAANGVTRKAEKAALEEFKAAAVAYVSQAGTCGIRYQRYAQALAEGHAL